MVCSCQGFSDIPLRGKRWFVINNSLKIISVGDQHAQLSLDAVTAPLPSFLLSKEGF